MVEIVGNLYGIYVATIGSHLALLFFLIGFPTQHWLNGQIIRDGTVPTDYNFGLFKASTGSSDDVDTKEFMTNYGFENGQYELVNTTIVLESITFILLAIPVALLYAVVLKRSILAFWPAVVLLILGGIFSVAAPANFSSNINPPVIPYNYRMTGDPGFSHALAVTSGCFALGSAVALGFAFYNGEMRLAESQQTTLQ